MIGVTGGVLIGHPLGGLERQVPETGLVTTCTGGNGTIPIIERV